MSENILTGFFKAKVKPIKPVNDEMTLCKCFIMALGKNNNKSNISKDAADAALPTLYGIPVVGHIYVDEDGVPHMGTHDMKIVKNDAGKYVFKMITVPYGFVPPQDNVHYEEVEEKDGTVNTYLVADIILWTGRYPELLQTKYSDEIYFHQSMEIKPLETKVENGISNILSYRYRALCLLGKDDDEEYNQTPCFPSARVEAYCFSIDDENLDALFAEFKNKVEECYGAMRSFEKGGKGKMELEKIKLILKEFNIEKQEDLPFAIVEDMTEDALREKLKEMQAPDGNFSDNSGDNGNEDSSVTTATLDKTEETTETEEFSAKTEESVVAPVVEESAATDTFALTQHTKHQTIDDCVRSMSTNVDYFYLVDYDEQYAYVAQSHYENGNSTRKTVRIPYIETDMKISLNIDEQEEVYPQFLTSAEVAELDKIKGEHIVLVEFKEKQEKENKEREYGAVISEFSDLSDIDEYKNVVSEALNFESAEVLKEKLFAVRGRYGRPKGKSSVDDIRIPIENHGRQNVEEDAETKFFSKYLPEALKNNKK